MNTQMKGSGEPLNPHNGTDPNTGDTNHVKTDDVTSGADFKPDWETIDKGIFLPPEFIQFAKQLRYMHDWIDEYCIVRDFLKIDHYREIICKITTTIVDIAENIGSLAGREFYATYLWNEPYCTCRVELDVEQSKTE